MTDVDPGQPTRIRNFRIPIEELPGSYSVEKDAVRRGPGGDPRYPGKDYPPLKECSGSVTIRLWENGHIRSVILPIPDGTEIPVRVYPMGFRKMHGGITRKRP